MSPADITLALLAMLREAGEDGVTVRGAMAVIGSRDDQIRTHLDRLVSRGLADVQPFGERCRSVYRATEREVSAAEIVESARLDAAHRARRQARRGAA